MSLIQSPSTASDAAQQLALINQREEQRLKQQGNGKVQVAFARDVKNSLLFQYDWGELLSAAPLALSLIGSCYVAATSPLARGVSLSDAIPKSGFKYLQHDMLKACLVQVSNSGQKAFLSAEKNMGLINSTSASLGGYMSAIVQYLPELPAPAAGLALEDKLQLLKDGSDDCLRYAQTIEKAFNEWLNVVCELYEVTMAKEEKTGLAQQENEIKIAGVSTEAELTQTNLNHATEAAKTLKENLDRSRDLFEKAADAVPSAWEVVGMNLVNNLATSATTTIAQALPAMMAAAVNPLSGVAALAAGTAGVKKDKSKSKPGAGSKGAAAQSLTRPQTVPDDSDDPAYPPSITCSDMLTILATMLGINTEKGIDWQSFAPKKNDSKTGLNYIKVTLKFQLDHVQWTNAKPSVELKEAITTTLNVLEKLEKVAAKDKELTSTKPDAKMVKEWQDIVSDVNAKVTKLATFARSMPGGAPGAVPLLNAPAAAPSAADFTAQQAALSMAQEKMSVTQAAYTSAQQNYAKASENAAKVEGELARIKANLASLKGEQMTMEGVKKILVQCIGTLIQMKAQITKLVQFFNALSAMVEHVVGQNVKDFIQQVSSARKVLMGNMSLLDISRQELYMTALMCQAYFSLFTTISKMYIQISINYITPGVALCDQLSKSVDGDEKAITRAVAERTNALEEYSDKAQTAVRELITKTQKEVSSTLESRVELVSKDVGMLPKLPPAVAKAITDGSEALTTAVKEGFDSYTAPAVAADLSMSPDDI